MTHKPGRHSRRRKEDSVPGEMAAAQGYPQNFVAPPVPAYPPRPVGIPPAPALTYRTLTAHVMVTGDAAIAKVSYQVPPEDPYAASRVFEGSGTSKRERGDQHDPVTGEILAAARAFSELAARLSREARTRVHAQDSERLQRSRRRTKEEWEEIQRAEAEQAVARKDLLDVLGGGGSASAGDFAPGGGPGGSFSSPVTLVYGARLPVNPDHSHENIRIKLSDGRYLAVEDGWVVLCEVGYPGRTKRLTKA